ncbi:putative signal transducing protein [Roseimarinus sediminis]|jgi:Zn-dependent membrane protease YugP|uniref:putative signal transducing protein n=1 Tax=Roseimarinus sediminis TaxID=1610899 RepID=UPI003D23B6FD
MEKGWKQVFLSGEMYQAEIARELLENNGIAAVVLNQKDSSYTAFGNIEVYVNEHDETKAIEILKELKH